MCIVLLWCESIWLLASVFCHNHRQDPQPEMYKCGEVARYVCFRCVRRRSVGSGGLLQPDQHAVRHHHGVLHGGVVCGDVGGAQVRVPLGRRTHRQEAHQVLRAQVHRLPHDVGAGPARRRDALPLQNRRAVPQELPSDGEDDPQAPVPRVRAHLPPALPRGGAAGRGGAPQHLLQALHLLRAGVQPDRAAGAGAAAGAHREAHRQGGAMSPRPLRAPRTPPLGHTLTIVSLDLRTMLYWGALYRASA